MSIYSTIIHFRQIDFPLHFISDVNLNFDCEYSESKLKDIYIVKFIYILTQISTIKVFKKIDDIYTATNLG